MTKVVINTCFGGYGLSNAAIQRYADIKGITLYPETDSELRDATTYWTVPAGERAAVLKNDQAFYKMSMEDRIIHNDNYRLETFNINDVARDDATLVLVVEALVEEADGYYAELSVVEIPDDVEWDIEEYDGKEHIAERHRTWS